MLKLENSIRGLSFSRVAFDLTIQDKKNESLPYKDIVFTEESLKFSELADFLYSADLRGIWNENINKI